MANLEAFANTPVFVLHGDKDTTVPTEHSRQFVKAMMIPGYDVVYREVAGGTHRSELIQGYEDEIIDFFDAVGGCASDPRLAFLEGRRNLARGKPYQYSAEPQYRLTRDEGDVADLTDGRLSARRDERIWFERHCVAWHGDPGVNIVIDLGAVRAVGELAGRFLGGREQSGLRFPNQVEVAVSSDGKTYRRVGLYRKLLDDAAFGTPAEEGEAWMHALRFKDLKARGRYVAFMLRFDGGFCAADELFVLGADHPAEQDRLGAVTTRPVVFPFGPDRYTAYPLKGDWYGAAIETWTCIGGFNTLTDKKKKLTLLLDLPPQVTLTQTMLNERYGGRPAPAPEPANVVVEGVNFRRYEIETRGLSERFWKYLFWKTDQPAGWSAPARIGARWDGGEQKPSEVTFHAVRIPRVDRPQRFHVSLDWMSHTFWSRTQRQVLDVLAHCGFTDMPYFGHHLGKDNTLLKEALQEAAQRGFGTVYNYSPIHAVQGRKKTNPEVLCQLPGGKRGHLCPSYRGPLLEEHLDHVGQGFALQPGKWVFLDCEVHWSSLEHIAECARCQERRQPDETIEDFAARMGREVFSLLRDRLESVRRQQGSPPFRMGSYAVHASRTRYPVLRFKDLHPDILDFGMPSIYTMNPSAVRQRVAADRAEMDHDAVIPWLQPGNIGEKPALALFEEALGCLLSGGLGVTYYTHKGFDAADLAAVARAVAIVNQYETLMAEGTPVAAWDNLADGVGVCGKQRGASAIWMVACEAAEDLETPLPRPRGVQATPTELSFDRGTLVKTRAEAPRIKLAPGDVRVYVVGE